MVFLYFKSLPSPTFKLKSIIINGMDLEFRESNTWPDSDEDLLNSTDYKSIREARHTSGLFANIHQMFKSKVAELEVDLSVVAEVQNPYPVTLHLISGNIKIISVTSSNLTKGKDPEFTLDQVKEADPSISLNPIYKGPISPISIAPQANSTIVVPLRLLVQLQKDKIHNLIALVEASRKCNQKIQQMQMYTSVSDLHLSLGAYSIKKEGQFFEGVGFSECPPIKLPNAILNKILGL